jgi:hypothetical protein
MEKTIKKGKTAQVKFQNGYERDNFSENDEILIVSDNDMREDCDDKNCAIKLLKEFPVYISAYCKSAKQEVNLFLSVEDAEELHRYIGEILETAKKL